MDKSAVEPVDTRLVIPIVGMHRSGTSLVTRGLQSLGINLGDRLSVLPADDNAKGHWEDKDVVALNDEVLAALGVRWDSTRQIEYEILESPSMEPLLQRALDLFDERATHGSSWAFKDPRTPRLLPFWLKAFALCRPDVRFVWVVRNPLAVARSLRHRNDCSELKSALMWLAHNLALLERVAAVPHVVVDYDRFLDSPEGELDRIASKLQLAVTDDQAIAEYLTGFVDRNLSHWNFSEEEALAGHGASLLAGRAYQWLARVARDEISLDDPRLTQDWAEIRKEHALFSGICEYLDFPAEQALDVGDRTVAEWAREIRRGDEHLRAEKLGDVGRELTDRGHRIVELEAQLADTRGLLDRAVSEYQELSVLIRDLQVSLQIAKQGEKERADRLIQQTQAANAEKTEALLAQIAQRDTELAALRDRVQRLAEDLDRKEAGKQQSQKAVERISRVLERQARELDDHEADNARLAEENSATKRDLSRLEVELSASNRKLGEAISLLNRERYTVVRPLFRKLYRGGASTVSRLPVPLQNLAKRIKRRVYPATIELNVTAGLQDASGFEDLLPMVLAAKTEQYDVFVFPVIDWHFRFQRPQHLAKEMAERGHRVFYLTTTFASDDQAGFRIVESPCSGVFIVQLSLPGSHPSIYEDVLEGQRERLAISALQAMVESCDVNGTVSIIDLPFWRTLAQSIPGNLIVYDCMDYHGGFSTNSEQMLVEEDRLLEQADLVITTSMRLSQMVAETAENTLIRNAGEIDYFKPRPERLAYQSSRPVVGYLGAISEWFDIELIAKAARRYSDWDFVLVGSTHMCDLSEVRWLDNVKLIGEVPYSEAAAWIHSFDVALIPFKLNELTMCTNPVKAYEYLAAGKPVVSTALPEVQLMDDMVHVAANSDDFLESLQVALNEVEDQALASKRSAWASQHDWSARGNDLERALADCYPMVSVVVLTYNNLEFTQACLKSLETFSHYPNWELILVDNASSDDTPQYLRGYAEQRPWVKLILNDENTGFAAGNNIGLSAAEGEYLIVLNNDTFVTRGWMLDLVRHLRKDPQLGLVGPVTNNIGNEAKIEVQYGNMQEMSTAAYAYTSAHRRELLEVRVVAFFCVAMSRRIYEEIGRLDEAFGRGFFEDDDYCNRVREAGYRVAIAEDVFVHHHLSASFAKLDSSVRQGLFEKNKKIYEDKWGEWIPHQYR